MDLIQYRMKHVNLRYSIHILLLRFLMQDEDMFGDNNFIGQATYPVNI